MTDPSSDDDTAAAASTLAKMKTDNQKQAGKKQKKEVMDALCARLQEKKQKARTSLYMDPKERVKSEAPATLSIPCVAAIRVCNRLGIEVPDSLRYNPAAALPDPCLAPAPLIAPVEDDSLLMVWPEEGEPDPEEAIDNKRQRFKFFDDVEEVKPKPGERDTLGWYCHKKKKEQKKNKAKGKVVMTGTINIKKEYD